MEYNHVQKKIVLNTLYKQNKDLNYNITIDKLKSFLDNEKIIITVKTKKDLKRKVVVCSNDEFFNIDGYYIETKNINLLNKRSAVKTANQSYLTIQQTIIFLSQFPNCYILKKIKDKEGIISAHISCYKCKNKHFKIYFNDTMSMFQIFYYRCCTLLKWDDFGIAKGCSKKHIFKYIKPQDCFNFDLSNKKMEANQCFRKMAQMMFQNKKCEMDIFIKYLLDSFKYAKSTMKKKKQPKR